MISIKDGCLFQWDANRLVELDDSNGRITQVHFAACGDEEAMVVPFTRTGKKIQVTVPNILLQNAGQISVFAVCTQEDEVKTVESYVLRVHERQRPSDYVYTETEVFRYSLLEQRVLKLEETGGVPGEPGFSPVVDTVEYEGGHKVCITDLNGKKEIDIKDGKDGYTPVKGVDYFDGEKGDSYVISEADKTEIAQEIKSLITGGKILWQGGDLMASSSGYITLSEPISSQNNGAVFVFSYYNNGAVSNTAFQHFFVSKKFAELSNTVAGGKGVGNNFFLHANGFVYVGTKYLYIGDSRVTGYDANDDVSESASASGIKYNNDKFCLRYVIGV